MFWFQTSSADFCKALGSGRALSVVIGEFVPLGIVEIKCCEEATDWAGDMRLLCENHLTIHRETG